MSGAHRRGPRGPCRRLVLQRASRISDQCAAARPRRRTVLFPWRSNRTGGRGHVRPRAKGRNQASPSGALSAHVVALESRCDDAFDRLACLAVLFEFKSGLVNRGVQLIPISGNECVDCIPMTAIRVISDSILGRISLSGHPQQGITFFALAQLYPASRNARPAFQSNSSCSTCNARPRSDFSSGSRAMIRRASSPATAIRSRCANASAKT